MDIQGQYQLWLKKANPELVAELKQIAGDTDKIKDAFRGDLSFGTGGLRGVIGAGMVKMDLMRFQERSRKLTHWSYKPRSTGRDE